MSADVGFDLVPDRIDASAAPGSTSPPVLPGQRPIDWAVFRVLASNEPAARSRFEDLVAALVSLIRPGARHVRGDGGDWGLDVVYGELIEGETIAVWQAKYFPQKLGSDERTKVAGSYDTIIKRAAEHGYRVGHWTLAVPLLLNPAELRWWGKFKREREKAHNLTIELWDATQLGTHLDAREATHLRRSYFGMAEVPVPLDVVRLGDPDRYDAALFVKQLEAAGIRETATARQQFFNAEVLRREVRNKAVRDEIAELEQRSIEVLGIWESRFASAGPDASGARQLYTDVQAALESHHRGTVLRALRANLIHTLGLVHFHVDEGRAGWVAKWREVANAHSR